MRAPGQHVLRDSDARRQAKKRLNRAKTAFTEAAKAAMHGDKSAAVRAASALQSVNEARAELRRLDEGER